jgi:hypothetical protein
MLWSSATLRIYREGTSLLRYHEGVLERLSIAIEHYLECASVINILLSIHYEYKAVVVLKLMYHGRGRGWPVIALYHVPVPCGQNYTPERRQDISTTALELLFRPSPSHFYTVFAMALASKTQSQNIFAKLKAKPANKVSYPDREGRSIGVNIACVDMFRLRRKEPNMELCTLWHLLVPGLLVEPP